MLKIIKWYIFLIIGLQAKLERDSDHRQELEKKIANLETELFQAQKSQNEIPTNQTNNDQISDFQQKIAALESELEQARNDKGHLILELLFDVLNFPKD